MIFFRNGVDVFFNAVRCLCCWHTKKGGGMRVKKEKVKKRNTYIIQNFRFRREKSIPAAFMRCVYIDVSARNYFPCASIFFLCQIKGKTRKINKKRGGWVVELARRKRYVSHNFWLFILLARLDIFNWFTCCDRTGWTAARKDVPKLRRVYSSGFIPFQ